MSPHLGGGTITRVNSRIHTVLVLTKVKYTYVIEKVEEYKSFNLSTTSEICNDSLEATDFSVTLINFLSFPQSFTYCFVTSVKPTAFALDLPMHIIINYFPFFVM